MKAETARLLRAVLRLIEDDVRELADTVIEIDEREAANATLLSARVAKLEAIVHTRREYSGEELEKVGFVPGGPLPWYRVWGYV